MSSGSYALIYRLVSGASRPPLTKLSSSKIDITIKAALVAALEVSWKCIALIARCAPLDDVVQGLRISEAESAGVFLKNYLPMESVVFPSEIEDKKMSNRVRCEWSRVKKSGR